MKGLEKNMALTDENNGMSTTMLVSPAGNMGGQPYPVYMGNQGGNGFGGDGNGWWIILLFILLASGNWGGNNAGYGYGSQPIIVNDGNGCNVQRGFDQAAIMSGINGVQTGVQNLSTQLCGCCGDIQMALANGFAGTTAAVTGAQNALSQQLYSNELANLNRSFAEQTANMQGFNGVQGQLAQGFCDSRAGLADLRYTVATEACADRNAISSALKDVLAANTASTQRILDQLCQDKIDAKNDEISALRQQIAMKDLAASQTAQNAFIAQGFSNEVDALYNRLNTCPVPTTPVYGRTPIFTCANNGCGCGGNAFAN